MREKNFKTVLYGGTCFSYMFPRVLPTYSYTRIRKREEDTFPHVAAEEAKQRHRASEKRHGCKTQRKPAYPRTSGFYKNNRLNRCSELVYIELSYYFIPTVVLKKERSGLRD